MTNKFSKRDTVTIPAPLHPGFRSMIAISNGVERNLLFKTWGGLGDQICAEPALRYALKKFKDCKISLASECPELFSHLQFHEVFNLKKVKPVEDNYLVFETIAAPDETNMVWLFFGHLVTHCVDFPSLCSMRMQLPNKEKELKLLATLPSADIVSAIRSCPRSVVVHPGKHWETKTFPKEWWNEVLSLLAAKEITPILIGADTDDNRSTVDVSTKYCLDFRNILSVMESVWVCQNANVVLTNDSSPLHMAASGNAWIGFVATCKHPDFITHWRHGEFGWRMKNLGLGGMWDLIDFCPNKGETTTVDKVEPDVLRSWLPEPKSVAEWVEQCFDGSSGSNGTLQTNTTAISAS